MLKKLIIQTKKVKKTTWILLAIIAVGIFFRTYNFRDWLRFSPDQARNAILIDEVINGKEKLPLWGPIAGGTNFKLGPIFYQFQYVAAKIFGNQPDKMAYPDLFFSILTIPLLFLFLKKYFSTKESLALTLIFSLSYFAIVNSRFSSNPNSTPFFILLFLYSILESSQKKKIIWPILAGLSLGIGIQLHTLLLLILPVVILAIFSYWIYKKKLIWKKILIIILFALLINIPQLIGEIKTEGANIKMFFLSADAQSNSKKDIFSNIGLMAACQIEYNFHMVSSLENKEECKIAFSSGLAPIRDYQNVPGNFNQKFPFILSLLASLIFSIGGYYFLGYYLLKEKIEEKKEFLAIILFFNFVSLLFLVPVASHITLRYYIFLFFIPFVLLGFWLRFILGKIKCCGEKLFYLIIIILIVSNLMVINLAAKPYFQKRVNDGSNSILGETEIIANFIVSQAENNKIAYLDGDQPYYTRYKNPLIYLAGRSGLTLINSENNKNYEPNLPLFYINKTTARKYKIGDEHHEYIIKNIQEFNKVTIFVFQTK